MLKLSLSLPFARFACASGALALTVTLSGCIVAPAPDYNNQGYAPPPTNYGNQNYSPPPNSGDQGYTDSNAEYQASEAPPALPDYEQPPCPEDGYLWTPGYWAWSSGGYFWVPGTWVQPPQVGVVWTPGYWAFSGSAYAFHAGYWGPHVGFYGGVNYGFGYTGSGYAGGAWQGNRFAYNRAVTNVNVTVVRNTYNTTVINNVNVNRISYNGGAGGIAAGPSAQERQFYRERHVGATSMQQQHTQQAAQNPALFARANGGHPSVAATPRPTAFNDPGVIRAHGAGAPLQGRGPSQQQQPSVQTQQGGQGGSFNAGRGAYPNPQAPDSRQPNPAQPGSQGQGANAGRPPYPNQQSLQSQQSARSQVQSQPEPTRPQRQPYQTRQGQPYEQPHPGYQGQGQEHSQGQAQGQGQPRPPAPNQGAAAHQAPAPHPDANHTNKQEVRDNKREERRGEKKDN